MPDEADPPRKHYGFKEAKFERVNAPRPEAPSADKSNRDEASARPADPNDVFTILRKNQEVADKAGLNAFQTRKIKSRRARDYWLILFLAEAGLGTLAWLAHGFPVLFVFAVSGMVLAAIGITWIMWQVMNKY